MVFEIYSKRQKRLRGNQSDIYIYDDFPKSFRIQVIYLWSQALGDSSNFPEVLNAYAQIVGILREEYGQFELSKNFYRQNVIEELRGFFIEENDPEKVLDAIELSFKMINLVTRKYNYLRRQDADSIANKTIEDLNTRFKEHALGYCFNDNQIVRIDSELIHEEIVKPLLRLLNSNHLIGAQDEYLRAHEHYRHGNSKEALTECLKSFESAMIGICQKRGWPHDSKATAKTLINVCFEKGLVPDFWQSHFNGLRTMLEGSVPTGRNKLAAHGQGVTPTEIPHYLVSYMMHMTASTLKFLAEADQCLE